MKRILTVMMAVAGVVISADAATITGVTAKQRYPWNGKVDITYTVTGDLEAGLSPDKMTGVLLLSVTNRVTGTNYVAYTRCVSGDTGTVEGVHHVVWDLNAQGLEFKSTDVVFTVAYTDKPKPYCVIDLSGGANASSYPVSYLTDIPSGGWTDEYKTTKLVLRRIEPGTFMMGDSYQVTLTKPFYCGVFEVTQKQYELVTGSKPSYFSYDNTLPVEWVSWNTIRGDSTTYNWPSSTTVDSSSFVGRLQARTGLHLDLPTEAQWEYACRAGTKKTYYWWDSMHDNYCWYIDNSSSTKPVGRKKPNAWGLYDMSGNVKEFCLDWNGDLSNGVTDPKGPSSGSRRVTRGGSWCDDVDYCASSYRGGGILPSSSYRYIGFRLVRTLSNK